MSERDLSDPSMVFDLDLEEPADTLAAFQGARRYVPEEEAAPEVAEAPGLVHAIDLDGEIDLLSVLDELESLDRREEEDAAAKLEERSALIAAVLVGTTILAQYFRGQSIAEATQRVKYFVAQGFIEEVTVEHGEQIITTGQSGDYKAYIVLAGSLDIVICDDFGIPKVVANLPRGSLAGENGILNGQPRTADVVANGFVRRKDGQVAQEPVQLIRIHGDVIGRYEGLAAMFFQGAVLSTGEKLKRASKGDTYDIGRFDVANVIGDAVADAVARCQAEVNLDAIFQGPTAPIERVTERIFDGLECVDQRMIAMHLQALLSQRLMALNRTK